MTTPAPHSPWRQFAILALVILLALAATPLPRASAAPVEESILADPRIPAAMYRGDPGRTGVFPGPAPQGDPVVAWELPLSTATSPQQPVVSNGVLYIGTSEGLLALDAATHETRWTFAGIVSPDDETWPLAPSALVVGGMVYAASTAGTLHALDAESGAEIWSRPGLTPLGHPAYHQGVLYLGSDSGALTAFDAATGEDIWSVTLDSGIDRWPSFADGIVYVTTWAAQAVALDAASGEIAWTYDAPTGQKLSPMVTVANGLAYLTRFVPDGAFTFVALDAETGAEVWTANLGTMGSFPVVSDRVVYLQAPDDNLVMALDARTGDPIWSHRVRFRPGMVASLVGGTLYIDTAAPELLALDIADGSERWSLPLDTPVAYGVYVVDRMLYFGSWTGTLYAVGGADSGIATMDGWASLPKPAAFDAGAVTLAWEATGSRWLSENACGMGVSPSGYTFALDCRDNDVKIFDPAGRYLQTWVFDDGENGQFRFGDESGQRGAIDFDANGNIYVFDSGNHRILVFDAGFTFVAAWDDAGDGESPFRSPVGAVDRQRGRVYVIDGGSQQVQVFDLTGAFIETWGDDGQFADPAALAVAPDGTVYVADAGTGRVQRFDPHGADLGDLGDAADHPEPAGIAIDAQGNAIVADRGSARLTVYAPSGSLAGEIDAASLAGATGLPTALALGPNGLLALAIDSGQAPAPILALQLPATPGEIVLPGA